jgi:hypothetical protein
MINVEWAAHRSGVHRLFPSTVSSPDVTSYALLRPDGNWSLMLVNRDENQSHDVRVSFDGPNSTSTFAGATRFVTFGSEQYVWHNEAEGGHAEPDNPPSGKTIAAQRGTVFTLPKASISVLRGLLSR